MENKKLPVVYVLCAGGDPLGSCVVDKSRIVSSSREFFTAEPYIPVARVREMVAMLTEKNARTEYYETSRLCRDQIVALEKLIKDVEDDG